MNQEMIKRLESINNLPTLPAVASKLQTEIANPKSDARSIAGIIENDPAIMARVLRMVNSALYFPTAGKEITSLQPAIARLGLSTIRNIVLSTSVFKAFPPSAKPMFPREEFWKHSICVGIVASLLYENSPKAKATRLSKDVFHLAGLLHDLGKIILENYFIEEFHQAIQKAQAENLTLAEAEWASYRTAHDEIGCWLANRWYLPWDVSSVIHFHHQPSEAPQDHQLLVGIVHLADYICLTQHLGQSGNHKPVYYPEVRELLGFDLANLSPIMIKIEEETKKSELMLSLLK